MATDPDIPYVLASVFVCIDRDCRLFSLIAVRLVTFFLNCQKYRITMGLARDISKANPLFCFLCYSAAKNMGRNECLALGLSERCSELSESLTLVYLSGDF